MQKLKPAEAALKNLPRDTIEFRADAEALLATISAIQAKRDKRLAKMNSSLAEVRSKYEDIASLNGELTSGIEKLSVWAKKHRAVEFGERMSLDLRNGTLRFQPGKQSVELLEGWTWLLVLKGMQALRKKFGRFLRKKEEPNLHAFLDDYRSEKPKLDANDRKSIGLEIYKAERFCVEIKQEKSLQ